MENVSSLVDEYETLLCSQLKTFSPDNDKKCTAIKRILHNQADWTPNGANAVVELALNYGSFILRNALALSIVLKIEDGKCGL